MSTKLLDPTVEHIFSGTTIVVAGPYDPAQLNSPARLADYSGDLSRRTHADDFSPRIASGT